MYLKIYYYVQSVVDLAMEASGAELAARLEGSGVGVSGLVDNTINITFPGRFTGPSSALLALLERVNYFLALFAALLFIS